MIKLFNLSIFILIGYFSSVAQINLPIYEHASENDKIAPYKYSRSLASSGITSPPDFEIRTMAEWEEIQALVVTWTAYESTLKEIVKYAKEECTVIIICSDSNQVKTYLTNYGINSDNLEFIEKNYDSIWMRDYGTNTIYKDDVDSIYFVDWIYNRPRPNDDVLPDAVADHTGITLYSTTSAPNDLVHTGGNFMTDGLGTAFSSKLVLEENDSGGQYNQTVKTEAEIDTILKNYMGIDRFILMETLPYDGIHHIDMHMKLLDEETLIVGEYPTDVADGPQITANIEYVINNFNSAFGDPYNIISIPMPPDASGDYPDDGWWVDYRTFTNSIFVNKTLLVPIYEEQYDSTALRILRENLPGYKVVGIDCNNIIQAGGALHCITRAIGVNDPLLISHQKLRNSWVAGNSYEVEALIKHRSGIKSATVYFTTDTTQSFQTLAMTESGIEENTWTATMPQQNNFSTVYYYIQAEAISGKTQVRPLTAPEGFWQFNIEENTGIFSIENVGMQFHKVFPNPASAITYVKIVSTTNNEMELNIRNVLGQKVLDIHNGKIQKGINTFFFDASQLTMGTYLLVLSNSKGRMTQSLVVR